MYQKLKCMWCGSWMYPRDDHHLWCANFPRDAIDAARPQAKKGANHD